MESSTLAHDKIHVHEESTSGIQEAFMESRTPSYDVWCSLSRPRIEEEIVHEIVATSVTASELLGFLYFVR